MKTAPPKRIYLQWEGTDDPPSPNDCEPNMGDITWCQERQFDSDVEYAAASETAELRALVGELAKYVTHNPRCTGFAPVWCTCGATKLLVMAKEATK